MIVRMGSVSLFLLCVCVHLELSTTDFLSSLLLHQDSPLATSVVSSSLTYSTWPARKASRAEPEFWRSTRQHPASRTHSSALE